MTLIWRRRPSQPQQEVLTPVEARQGFLDRPVLIVLIVSLALVCALFALLLLRM